MRINRNHLIALGLLAIGFVLNTTKVAFSADATGTGVAGIIEPIGITAERNLDFGRIVPDGASTCTVSLTAAETTVVTNTCPIIDSNQTSAAFEVTGTDGQSYSITIPASFLVNRVGGPGGVSMTVDQLAHSYGAGSGLLSGTTDTFWVGGRLNVLADQMRGNYSGTFTVSVEYE